MPRRHTLHRPHNGGLALLCAALLAGCATEPRTYGASATRGTAIGVAALLSHPESWAGKTVTLRGKVTRVCQHVGCWFYFADGGGEVYVDLENGLLFVIPTRSAGRSAEVTGTVKVEHGQPRIVGRRVTLY